MDTKHNPQLQRRGLKKEHNKLHIDYSSQRLINCTKSENFLIDQNLPKILLPIGRHKA